MVDHRCYSRDAYLRRYANALADAGAQVDVLCLRDPNQSFSTQRNGVRVFTIPITREYESGRRHLLEYGMAFILFSARLLTLYIQNHYQVIHVHNMPDFLAFTALIPGTLGAKLILDIRDPMPEIYMSKREHLTNALVVKLMQVQEKLSSLLADAIIAANSNFKDNLVERGIPAHKITIVNYVPDPKVFDRGGFKEERRNQDRHFTLIYPGTIAPRYGLDVAIRALPLLVTKIPQIRLMIIGPQTEHVGELAALAQQLGVSFFVQFKPVIPVDEVSGQIGQADVGIYPALPDPHMDIATPMKVLEYAVMGIPIIASRLKILEDLFTDSALMLFDPGNVDQFARCVLELFRNPARREQLVRNADSVFVRPHSWSNERRAYFDLLDRLLAPGEGMGTSGDGDEGLTEEAV